MGLDVLDIVFRIEHRLGIDLRPLFKVNQFKADPKQRQAEARIAFSTAGNLHAFVLERIAATPGWRWPADRMFQIFRERWATVSGQAVEFIQFDTPLDHLFLPAERRRRWRAFGQASGLGMPKLSRSSGGELVFFLSAVAAALAVLATFVMFGWQTLALATLCAVGMIALERITRIQLPKNCYTVGQLIQRLADLNGPDKKAIGEAVSPSPEEVWIVLQGILVEVLVVPREKVTPQARLVQDLGMD